MKKLLSILILSVITLACTFGLVACECKHEFTNYLSDNNATYESDGTKTAVCDKGCGTTNTIADIGTKLESKVIYDFEIVDGVANITVSNDVEEYDFNTVITKVGLSNFIVGLDKHGTQTNLTKKVDLEFYGNTFYIFETLNDEIVKTVEVIIYREPMIYTVTFEGLKESQNVNVYKVATVPIVEPTKAGYTFNGWDFDFTTPITSDIKILAKWNAIFTLDGNTITGLTEYGKTLTEIEIPKYVNGVKITTIGDFAFKDCSKLTSVTISERVTSIGDYSFFACIKLADVNFKNNSNLKSIGELAFSSCHSLKNMSIPNSVTSIGGGVFYDCKSLTSVTIPNSITSISGGAFQCCSSLTSIVIPESVTSIGGLAFQECISLTSVIIPNSVVTIDYQAFYDCKSLTSIVIPDSVTSIGERAFEGCSKLKIYCEAKSKPSGWDSSWNKYSNYIVCPVVWGYVKDNSDMNVGGVTLPPLDL